MIVMAVLDVDESAIVRAGSSFENEMLRAKCFGITLLKSKEVKINLEYEYAAFIWNMDLEKYKRLGEPVTSEMLCRNRFLEYTSKKLIDGIL